MNNWCFNLLRVTGPSENVSRFQNQAVGFSPWRTPQAGQAPDVLNFQSLLPIPNDVLAAGYRLAGRRWAWRHWGCRSGADWSTLVNAWDGGVLYQFDTVWVPPLTFVE